MARRARKAEAAELHEEAQARPSAAARGDSWVARHEKAIIAGAVAVAAVRVLIFCAAFPFFTNLDEQNHLDNLVRYGHGQPACQGDNRFDAETAALAARYGTWEYLKRPEDYRAGKTPVPVWLAQDERAEAAVARKAERWRELKNGEAGSAPVYCAIAGAWYDLGKLLGLQGGRLLYWTRFLNAGAFALLVLAAYLVCRKVFPSDRLLWVGVPLLLAFFPQDVFYSINNDVLSPLFFLVTLYLLFALCTSPQSWPFYLSAGLAVAATFLVKVSNLPVLAVLAVTLVLMVRRSLTAKTLGSEWPKFLLLVAAAVLPIAAWCAWNLHAWGDATASAEKLEELGWTRKPPAETLDHPIFTPGGAGYFLSNLTKSFWRGELVWGGTRLSSPGMDWFYLVSTALLVGAGAVGAWLIKDRTPPERLFSRLSLLAVGLFLLFFAVLSLLYDFGKCAYPSRELPYFVSGRLMAAAIVPFLILYLDGLGLILRPLGRRIPPLAVVLAMGLVITCAEAAIRAPVFGSLYNWFHLP